MKTALSSLRNIGSTSSKWLERAGVRSVEDLEALGAVEAYVRLKIIYPERVTLNLLYALQGALLDVPWSVLPAEMKAELAEQARQMLTEMVSWA